MTESKKQQLSHSPVVLLTATNFMFHLTSFLLLATTDLPVMAEEDSKTVGWRNDGTGIFPDAKPPLKWGMKDGKTTNVVWQTELPNFSASSAIVVGDRIFTGSKQYDLLCLDKKTGNILWVRTSSHYDAATGEDRKRKPDLWKEADGLTRQRDALNEEIATCGPTGAFALGIKKEKIQLAIDRLIFKVDPKRYKVYWRGDGGMANGTPASDGTYVYFWNAMGVMSCYDFDGKRQWINFQPTRKPHQEHGYHESPLLIDGKAIVLMRGLQAFDMKTGKLAWETEPIQTGNQLWYGNQVKAVVAGQNVFIIADGSIWDSKTGTCVTKKPTHVYKNNSTPVVNNGYVCLVRSAFPNKWDQKAIVWYKLPKTFDEKPVLQQPDYPYDKEYGSLTASPLCYKGLMYVVTSTGTLFVYDLQTVQEVYRKKIDFGDNILHGHRPYGIGVVSSPAVAGGKIFLVGNTGKTVIIEPGREYKEVASNLMERSFRYSWNERPEGWVSCPFFEGSRIYYRAQKHMYCIGEN